jgi:hypothetical protein
VTRHDITLDLADVDTIAEGGVISLTGRGTTFEVTSEDTWTASTSSTDPAVHRFALSPDQLDRLRWGREVTVLPSNLDGTVHFTVDTTAVTR